MASTISDDENAKRRTITAKVLRRGRKNEGTKSTKGLTRPSTSLDLRQPPLVRFLVLVEQRLDLLLPLPFADLVRISNLEELRRNLHQPLGLDSRHVMTVLSCRKHQFVVDNPLRVSVEQR